MLSVWSWSPFSSLILFIWVFSPLPPLLVWLRVCLFCLLSQKTHFLNWLLYFFSISISFIYTLILIISHLLLIWSLVFSCSSKSSRCNIRSFIWDFSIVFNVSIWHYTSILILLLLYPTGFDMMYFHLTQGSFWFPF